MVGATHFPWVGAAIETQLANTTKVQPIAIHALSTTVSPHHPERVAQVGIARRAGPLQYYGWHKVPTQPRLRPGFLFSAASNDVATPGGCAAEWGVSSNPRLQPRPPSGSGLLF